MRIIRAHFIKASEQHLYAYVHYRCTAYIHIRVFMGLASRYTWDSFLHRLGNDRVALRGLFFFVFSPVTLSRSHPSFVSQFFFASSLPTSPRNSNDLDHFTALKIFIPKGRGFQEKLTKCQLRNWQFCAWDKLDFSFTTDRFISWRFAIISDAFFTQSTLVAALRYWVNLTRSVLWWLTVSSPRVVFQWKN